MAKKQTQNQSGLSAENVDENVDKIREILFGGQMRDYEQRFADLEKRLTRNIEKIATDFEKRVERLNNGIKRDVEKLAEQLRDERKVRRDESKQGSKQFKELAEQVETWCVELEEQIGSETHDLRGILQEQNEELSAMIHDSHEELSKDLAIETRKLGREDLATVLSEVAARLKKNGKLSGA